MAYIRLYYVCPTCGISHKTFNEASECRRMHLIVTEKWAVGKNGKSVMFHENAVPGSVGSKEWALVEAERDDMRYASAEVASNA